MLVPFTTGQGELESLNLKSQVCQARNPKRADTTVPDKCAKEFRTYKCTGIRRIRQRLVNIYRGVVSIGKTVVFNRDSVANWCLILETL